ncbi:type I-E CRISPR-associated protein Cse1/CasA [Corynebacterium sp. Marseille-P4321]|uniref:type I-E CRISPR-associated protein Cse1/CasA n=1 Tax=Corynebacterium sp. Marseille-P4321 TaxID=2736603 RepID=UPI00158C55DB|nr:type I-E CRISPR-associated protein Cse1/CasA [Corynebacterium sp. Marseille-P4321]
MSKPDDHPSFNLIEQPWIICATTEGIEELSIRQIFDGTSTPVRILGDSPTQDYAVLRVLLAIFWRAHLSAPSNAPRWEQWFIAKRQKLLEDGRDDCVLDYLSQHQNRFDLFDRDAPFMQVGDLETTNATRQPVSRILPDAEQDYFTMRTHEGRRALTFAEAARWLIHTQAYDYSGIKSGAIGDPRVKRGKGYPIGTGWTGMTGGTVIKGRSLLETLLLNTTADVLSSDASDDLPVWEREPDSATQRNDRAGKLKDPPAPQPQGAADLATWQSRRIRLFPEGDLVVSVLVSNGDRVPDAGKNIFGDPMTPYRFSKNQTKKGQLAFYPKPYDAQRTMWRSLDALIATESDPGFTDSDHAPKRPANLINFSTIARHQRSNEVADVSIVSMGYGPQSSSVGTVVTGDIGLPLSLLQDDNLSRVHRQYVRDAAEVTKNAAVSLGWFAGQLELAAGGEYVFDADAADRLYTVLEPLFIRWLRNLNLDEIENEAIAWQRQIRNQLLEIADEKVRGAGQKALVGRIVDGSEESAGRVISAGSLYRNLLYRLSQDLPLLREHEREQKELRRKGDQP